MEQIYLLDYSSNYKIVEKEERYKFLNSLLDQLGIEIDLTPENGELNIDQRVLLRKTLSNYDIEVLEELDGSMDVFCEKEKIGIWEKPRYVLKQDPSQIDRKKRHYLEMHCKYWTILDSE